MTENVLCKWNPDRSPSHFQTRPQELVYEALGAARVSFAPSEDMETMLGTKIGAATVFSSLLDGENKMQIIFDKEVLSEEWYGCSDGTTTGYMKIRTEDIYRKFLPYTQHMAVAIEVWYGALPKQNSDKSRYFHPNKWNGKKRPAFLWPPCVYAVWYSEHGVWSGLSIFRRDCGRNK